MAKVFNPGYGTDQAAGGAPVLRGGDMHTQRVRMLTRPSDIAAPSAEPFHTLLRAYRERADLTQTALARLIQRSTSLISLLENGQRHPTRDNVAELSRALQLSRDEEATLYQAAGFTTNDVQGAVDRIVAMLTAEMELDDADQLVFQADLVTLINGWRSLFGSARQYADGQFEKADEQLAKMSEHAAYSPTLTAYTHLCYAATLTQLGQLKRAEEMTRDTRLEVERLDTVSGWAPWLRAEMWGTQGMLALRLGQYQMAHTCIGKSAGIYERMLQGTPQEQSIGYQGLGRSNKRLAELTLFEGQPGDAFRYCVSAEAYLRMAQPSAQRDRWLRRTNEMKAWALAKLGDFARALELRAAVRAECEAAGDEHGVIKNTLYVASDYCRQLNMQVNQTGLETVRDPERRREMIRAALGTGEAADWLDKAEWGAREALAKLEQIGQQVLQGHCLRTLGTVLHYRGVLGDDERLYKDARVALSRAVTLESSIGQERRIPALYESLAQLEWDSGNVLNAASYYMSVLQALDQPLIISTDAGSEALRGRAVEALKVLGVGTDGAAPPLAIRGSEEWQSLSRQLIKTVETYIQDRGVSPLTHSDRDPVWLERMAQLDCDDGRRVLAQNKLSASLALALPAGYVPEAAEIHGKRFYTFEERVRRAADPAGRDLNHDLCCRSVVERGIANPEMRSLVREQVRRAAEYLECSRGYLLDAGLYMLPLAFAVKRDQVLLEVPGELAARFGGPVSDEPPEEVVCFSIQDGTLARKLTELFDALVDEARGSVAGYEPTQEWLEHTLRSRNVAGTYAG